MGHYVDRFLTSLAGFARHVAREFTQPVWGNYVYAMLVVSALVFALELTFPWRKDQPRIRRDFWLDAFYLVFNFLLFPLLGFQALAVVVDLVASDVRQWMGLDERGILSVVRWPAWAQILALFVARDFVHYWIHRLLHRVPTLWRFHQLHHSVEQMGFAAHFRFHFVESVLYRTLEYLPLGLLGFSVQNFFVMHLVAITIGHLNHANLRIPLGPLRFLFNSAEMHIWHHAKELPAEPSSTRHGANFGLSLSCWDWIFGTVHWPQTEALGTASGRDAQLGFPGDETFPRSSSLGKSVWQQWWAPFR